MSAILICFLTIHIKVVISMSELLSEKTISELAPLIKNKIISPIEIVDSVMEQIKLKNKTLNAYIDIYESEAREVAFQSEIEIMNGNYRGLLHGIPIGLKDNFYIKNKQTTMGSKIYKDFKPSTDATIVKKLRQNGVIFTGKLNLDEFAYGTKTENPHYGTSRNPWNQDKITGGSSGGSAAAVSSHMSLASVGSETGGSLRAPGSFCGLVSFKPTFGLISKVGCYPLAPTLDHIGPMAKTVQDTKILLNALAGYDAEDLYSSRQLVKDYTQLNHDVSGLVIGVNEDYFFKDIDEEVQKSVITTIQKLERLGAKIEIINFNTINDARYAYALTLASEASAVHHKHIRFQEENLGDNLKTELCFGETISAIDYLYAQNIREQVRQEFEQVFKKVDVIISPTVPFIAPSIGENKILLNNREVAFGDHVSRMIRPTTLIGIPAITVPCGMSQGLPIGAQILSAPFNEVTILKVAQAIENMELVNK